MNKECDYSAAYVEIHTSGDLTGQGMTFSKLHRLQLSFEQLD